MKWIAFNWFGAGFCSFAALDSLVRGDMGWAVVELLFVAGNVGIAMLRSVHE